MAATGRDDRDALFDELARTGSREVRNRLVESYAPLAEFFAARHRQRGAPDEDLRQVAQLALVNAIDRFDPTLGVQFSTFAGRTIDGELKRYFRDRTWSVRVPRSLQETALEVRRLAEEMTMDLGRPPAVAELAERSGHDPDVVLRALDVGSARTARSLDSPTGEGADGMANQPVAALADTERGFEQTEVRLSVSRLLDDLDDRLRRVVELRFYEELTQQEIADRLGISQMHVSRLLRSALEKLRAQEQR